MKMISYKTFPGRLRWFAGMEGNTQDKYFKQKNSRKESLGLFFAYLKKRVVGIKMLDM